MGRQTIDVTNQKFGRLLVVKRHYDGSNKNALWLCKCDCGNEIVVTGGNLRSRNTTSCGCAKVKHGYNTPGKYSPEYWAWHSMIQRCTNPNHGSYHNYGGRGISVCKEWLEFTTFLKDMGDRPSANHSLDRIDVNGNYESSNCRWATIQTQARNKRVSSKNKTGVTGVSWSEDKRKYRAVIYFNRKQLFLGYYPTVEDAKAAREEAELLYYRESS